MRKFVKVILFISILISSVTVTLNASDESDQDLKCSSTVITDGESKNNNFNFDVSYTCELVVRNLKTNDVINFEGNEYISKLDKIYIKGTSYHDKNELALKNSDTLTYTSTADGHYYFDFVISNDVGSLFEENGNFKLSFKINDELAECQVYVVEFALNYSTDSEYNMINIETSSDVYFDKSSDLYFQDIALSTTYRYYNYIVKVDELLI